MLILGGIASGSNLRFVSVLKNWFLRFYALLGLPESSQKNLLEFCLKFCCTQLTLQLFSVI